MTVSFLHVADCHLGYDQYGLRERYNDFTRAFLAIADEAVARRVDFVLLAGDLFHKRTIDALTLDQAIHVLERLQRAGIPCIAVEGNHEKAYWQERLSWMDFLARQKLISLLSPTFADGEEDPVSLHPYTDYRGAYLDPVPGVRVFGLKYMGAGTGKALERLAVAMQAMPEPQKADIHFTILMAHTGIEGVMPGQSGGLTHRQLAPLRPHVDYLALGHIHKPFCHEEWIYNPGSPETCSLAEVVWEDRGYFLVQIADPADRNPERPHHSAALHSNPRRPFVRLAIKADLHPTPAALMTFAESYLTRQARDQGFPRQGGPAPVVELQLYGNLPFDPAALDLDGLREQVERTFRPLLALVKNQTRPTEFQVGVEEGSSRGELEQQILEDLFRRDARFSGQPTQWADLALTLKRMALENGDPRLVLAELEERSRPLMAGPGDADAAGP